MLRGSLDVSWDRKEMQHIKAFRHIYMEICFCLLHEVDADADLAA